VQRWEEPVTTIPSRISNSNLLFANSVLVTGREQRPLLSEANVEGEVNGMDFEDDGKLRLIILQTRSVKPKTFLQGFMLFVFIYKVKSRKAFFANPLLSLTYGNYSQSMRH
jgi:hypothetical protein